MDIREENDEHLLERFDETSKEFIERMSDIEYRQFLLDNPDLMIKHQAILLSMNKILEELIQGFEGIHD